MAYSIKIKKEVLDKVHQGMSVRAVAKMYMMDNHTIHNWLKSPDHYLGEVRAAHKQYDLEEKIEILRLVEKGNLSVPQIADLKNINQHTIRNWIRDKRRILAVYSSQEQRSMNDDLSISSGEEAESVGTADNKDTKQHIRDLKDENEFLKAKVAYLEALMELNGTPASGFKKKSSTGPSIESSKKESET